ncbi:MAG: Phosphatidylglycerophosphate synthase [Desulfonauticus sp. 38_4375]|nr:MAG: Phosphatidylglycerophosphate synthase [Desulfonauticus sp. 38_4375]
METPYNQKKYSEKDVEDTFVLKTWYASIFVLPLAKKLILIFSNNRLLTPNQITFCAFIFRLLSCVLFLRGNYNHLVIGSIFYYLAYLFDCVDGPVARLTNQTSDIGRYLDHISDLVGDILILCSLAWSQKILFTYTVFGMIIMQLTESYISYLSNLAIKSINKRLEFALFKLFNKYKKWWFKRNFKSFLSLPDYTALVFIAMPILGMPKKGIEIGFWVLFIIVCYTILSSFVAAHTEENRFP